VVQALFRIIYSATVSLLTSLCLPHGNRTKPVLYLSRLAFYEQIYAAVLFFEDVVEIVLKA
jgi:hypothetical protein